MDKKIKEILEDLYKMDAGLREREKELEKTIAVILKSRPNISIDEKFKKELYGKILAMTKESPAEKSRRKFILPAFFYGRYGYAFTGATFMLLLMTGLGFAAIQGGYFQVGFTPSLDKLTYKENSVGSNAFGTLGGSTTAKNSIGDEVSEQSMVAPAASAVLYGRGGGGGGVSMDLGMPIRAVSLKYVYKGEELDLSDRTVEVLRRKGISEDPSKFGSLLTRAGMGLVNLFSFAPLQIETISFRDNRDFGYMVSANMRDGNIEVNQNQNWVSAISRCVDQRCIMENQMKIENMPSDAELILLANDFLKKHGIKLENFGEPVIDSTWRGEYEKMAVKTDAWIPEIVSVAYPIKVKGTLVNDLSGGKVSLQVNINAREQKVTGMYNLWAQNYDVSKYDAITDSTKILAIANQGGYYGVPVMEGGEVIEIDLGTPTKVYAHIMNYNSTGYDNLLVPSLLFPVIKTPARDDYHFPENIIVPLAKDLVSYQSISIMREPMMLEGVSATMPPSEGSAPSSGKME